MSVFGLASAVDAVDNPPRRSHRDRALVLAKFDPSEPHDLAHRVEVAGRADAHYLNLVRTNLERADTRDQTLADLVDVAAEGTDGTPADQPEKKNGSQLISGALGALALWIPAEIVAAYGAFVVMAQPADRAAPPNYSLTIWVAALIATPALVWLTAWAKKAGGTKWSAEAKRMLGWSVFLSPFAFALWSAAVPASAWNLIELFRQNSAEFLFGLLIVTTIFTLIASKLTGKKPEANE